jgi:serine/threonine protein phosphatase 1
MLKRLFAAREHRSASVPEGCVVYAIGDVHGRADLLERLQDLIQEDADRSSAARKVVVYLGDYVDRGPHSGDVIDILLEERLHGFESVHLLGNHEDALLTFLNDISVARGWFAFGGLATLQSYGLRPDPSDAENPDRLRELQAKFAAALPPSHLQFLQELALYHLEGDYLFVHAGLRPGKPLEKQDPRDLICIRDEFLASRADHGHVVVHGHSIAEEPQVARNRIGIDTGAYATGRLTALRLEAKDRVFLST